MSNLYEEYQEPLEEVWNEVLREGIYHDGYKNALRGPIYMLFHRVKDKDELINKLLEEQHDWEAEAENTDYDTDARYADGAAQACEDTIEMLRNTK